MIINLHLQEDCLCTVIKIRAGIGHLLSKCSDAGLRGDLMNRLNSLLHISNFG